MKSKKWTTCLLVFYLIALTWIILMKLEFSFEHLPHIRSINLIPFAQSATVNQHIDYKEIYQNLLAFIPYGLFIEILMKEKPFFQKVLPIFLTSLSYEVLQYIFSIGASDITDLITNTLGGMIGILLAFLISKTSPNKWIRIINTISLIFAILLTALLIFLLAVNNFLPF